MIRTLSRAVAILALACFAVTVAAGGAQSAVADHADRIDRAALVARHCPVLAAPAPTSPLTIGNGRFAFTADITGLQTFQDLHTRSGMPLETLARGVWHSAPNPQGYTLDDASSVVLTDGRPVSYPNREKTPAGQWLRMNPHVFPLGQISFTDAHGKPLDPSEVRGISQRLDLWTGLLHSRFIWRDVPVEVTTAVDPDADLVAVRVVSAAFTDGRLCVALAFPRGHDMAVKNTPPHDWSGDETHLSTFSEREPGHAWLIERARDALHYEVAVATGTAGGESEKARLIRLSPHRFLLSSAEAGDGRVAAFDVTVDFRTGAASVQSPSTTVQTQAQASGSNAVSKVSASAVFARSSTHWSAFWQAGAAVDFSGSTDPRAAELERRVVLSQYLCAVQLAGGMPPQETGLTCNSWYGKHHTEMAWWHLAHFALWGRPAPVAEALAWYDTILPQAEATAAARGLRGARWSKMVGPDGRESPGSTSFIVWNQPHPIHLAELLWRADPRPEVLRRWRAVVQETADCMVSMLRRDPATGTFHLGPPVWIAQELYDPKLSSDPTYELTQWRYAIEVAQAWRQRLGEGREAAWDAALAALASAPVHDGKYVSMESIHDTWTNPEARHDHPSFLMALGMLPGPGIDRDIMRRTLLATLAEWRWEVKIWGWDYPMIAMCAARLGERRAAVDILLRDAPNNRYLPDGHCPQRADLGVYLPANGSLLAAVAMMAGGWEGAPAGIAPGFPDDGSWHVRAEGLTPLP